MASVLVVEDDADIRVLLANALKHAGHSALAASTARAGLDMARDTRPDLILLDLILPDLGGTCVVEALKSDARTRDVPIIILTARGAEADRISGLESGADDYVTKPFSLRELMLRVNVALRRAVQPAPRLDTLEYERLRIETHSHRVFVADAEIALTPTEFRLLATLAGRPGRVQSRQTLLADVWGMQPNLETRTVDTHIKRLREKLGETVDYIETVRGVGYRFREDEQTLERVAG